MEKRTIWLSVIIFLSILVGMFVYSFIMKKESVSPSVDTDSSLIEETETFGYMPDTITGKVFYRDGQYVFAGVVTTPTPCDLLQVETVVMESMPEQIRLDFTTLNTAEACIQVLSDQRFLTEPVGASESATFSATFNGQPVSLNLVPALPGETPEEFELFIKG